MEDDDKYWKPWSESPPRASNLDEVKRSQENSTYVAPKANKCGRAPEPSPLLKEYMEKKGMAVK